MASGPIYVANNLVFSAGASALSSNNEDPDFPLEGLIDFDPFPQAKVKTVAANDWFKCDFGAAKSFGFVAFINTNPQEQDQMYFQANSTDSWGSPSVDQVLTQTVDSLLLPIEAAPRIFFHEFSSTQSYRWVRAINKGGQADGPWGIGEWWVGTKVQLNRPPAYPYQDNFITPKSVVMPDGGSPGVNLLGSPVRQFSPRWISIQPADILQLEAMQVKANLTSRRMLWRPDSSKNDVFMVHMLGDIRTTEKDINNRDITALDLEALQPGL